jgi:hypothetical protein
MFALIVEGQVVKYPVSLSEIRQTVSLRDPVDYNTLARIGVYRVRPTAKPPAAPTQVVYETAPVYQQARAGNGTWLGDDPSTLDLNEGWEWVQTWAVRDATAEEVQLNIQNFKSSIVRQVQRDMDHFAASRGYDNMFSACTYANSTVAKFQTEGQRCLELRDQTWATLYSYLSAVETGQFPMPSGEAEVLAILPKLTWNG